MDMQLYNAHDEAFKRLLDAVEEYKKASDMEDDTTAAVWGFELSRENVMLAARLLTEATDLLPRFDQPVMWRNDGFY